MYTVLVLTGINVSKNYLAKLKRRLFVATVESVLLYGSETWTITITQEISLNSCYTHILKMAQNGIWQRHMKNEDLYAGLECVSDKIRKRRLRLADIPSWEQTRWLFGNQHRAQQLEEDRARPT